MAPAATANGISHQVNGKSILRLDDGTLQISLPNPSLQVTADHKLKQIDAPVHLPGPKEVLIHVKAVGICGSDIHFWKSGRIGSLVVEGDCILGHEAAGVVLVCGSAVTDFELGDRVAIEPGVPCESCFLCAEGRYNLCEDVRFAGVFPYHGAIQRVMVHPAKWLHNFSEGALLEPLSVVLHGMRRAQMFLGCGVAICGAGPIGLIALAAARASGASPLLITDVEPRRLEFAKRFVPSCLTYQVCLSLSSEENAQRIRRLFGGSDEHSAPRTVFECTGVESSVCTAAYIVRRGGTVVVIGVGKPTMNNLPFMHISLAEIDLLFTNRYCDTWPAGIECLSSGILDLRPLVTATFPLEKALDALHSCADIGQGNIKIHIVDETEVVGL